MSITVTTVATPEIIDLGDETSLLQTVDDTQIFEVTSSGPDLLIEQQTEPEIVLTPSPDLLTEQWTEATIIESCMQGPPGPPGAVGGTYPAKRMTYSGGELTEVRLYSDSLATQLVERRYIGRTSGNVTSIVYYDENDNVLRVRQFAYNPDGTLSGVTDT